MPTSEHHHHMVMVGKAIPTGLGTGDWANIQIYIDADYDTFHNNYIIQANAAELPNARNNCHKLS